MVTRRDFIRSAALYAALPGVAVTSATAATALGVRTAFVNQPVEVPALRTQFSQWLGLGSRRPDLVVRFGRGP